MIRVLILSILLPMTLQLEWVTSLLRGTMVLTYRRVPLRETRLCRTTCRR